MLCITIVMHFDCIVRLHGLGTAEADSELLGRLLHGSACFAADRRNETKQEGRK